MNHDVRLRIEGSLLERLLQQALQKGAVFADIRRTGKRSIVVSSDARSAEILLSLCRRYGLSCRVLSRGGWAALFDLIRARWTIAPAILLCALICALFLSRIWMVDISFTGPCAQLGNEKELLAQIERQGIHPGMAASDADTELLQKQLIASSGNYSFIGVRRQGIRLLVEASPEVPAPELYAIAHARDLVAERDGVVEGISVYSGNAAVSIGDTVLRGDLLISGEEAVGKDSETGESINAPISALGEVIARCWFEGSAEGEIESSVFRRTGENSMGCRLKLLDFSLPLIECEGYASEEIETEILPVVGLFLPLEIERSVHWETENVTRSTDPEVLEEQLKYLAQADARRAISMDGFEYEIASVWTDTQRNGNTLHVRAVYEIYTDIAATRDELIEEVY